MKSSTTGFRAATGGVAALAMVAVMQGAVAAPVVIGFEGFADSTPITTQITDMTFVNATVLTSGIGLNEFEFPPKTGTNVVFDDGGPITITFAAPVFGVGGYFNYAMPLTFTVFDSVNAVLISLNSAYASNLGLSGDPGSTTNELLSYSNLGGLIAKLVITGDPLGGSFTMDDLTVDFGASTPMPEPQTLALVLGLLGAGFVPGGWLRRRTVAAGQSV